MEDLAYRLFHNQKPISTAVKFQKSCRWLKRYKENTIFGSLNVRLLLTFLWKNILTEVNFQYVLKSSQNLAQKREQRKGDFNILLSIPPHRLVGQQKLKKMHNSSISEITVTHTCACMHTHRHARTQPPTPTPPPTHPPPPPPPPPDTHTHTHTRTRKKKKISIS